MAKLTLEEKKQIYKSRKNGVSVKLLSIKYNINKENINYLIALIDKHGFDVLRKDSNRVYSKELKQEIINKVLIDKQSVRQTALEYGLTGRGMLSNWINSYKKNGYVIVEKKKGRPSTMKQNKPTKRFDEMTDKEKIKYLQEKNLYLEAENEYLKKLQAVVQQRKNRQQKKK